MLFVASAAALLSADIPAENSDVPPVAAPKPPAETPSEAQQALRAALQVQAEFDLLAEIVFDLRDRSGEGRKSDQSIDAKKDHRKNKQRFPLQIRIHD